MRATDIILILLILFLPLIYEHGWSKGYKRGFSEAEEFHNVKEEE